MSTAGLFMRETTKGYLVRCPGCSLDPKDTGLHHLNTKPAELKPNEPCWDFDGNLESPTFSPSLLCTTEGWAAEGIPETRCHSFIRGGQWQFLGDCTHALAGKTVAMVPYEREDES